MLLQPSVSSSQWYSCIHITYTTDCRYQIHDRRSQDGYQLSGSRYDKICGIYKLRFECKRFIGFVERRDGAFMLGIYLLNGRDIGIDDVQDGSEIVRHSLIMGNVTFTAAIYMVL